jgi:hypothetical protein
LRYIHCSLPKKNPKCRKKVDDVFRSDLPFLSVGLARLDLLAGLLDLLQDGLVVERLCGDNLGGLGLEGDVVGLNTWCFVSACRSAVLERRC